MADVVFLSTPVLGDTVTPVVPGTTMVIANYIDAISWNDVTLLYTNENGTSTSLEVEIWAWDSAAYRKLGETYLFDESYPAVPLVGGVTYAVTILGGGPAGSPAPTTWALKVGRAR